MTKCGCNDEWVEEYRQNFVYIRAWIMVMQTCIESEAAYCDWSHELDENGVSESPMGQMLGSNVVGRIAGKFEEYDRVSEIRDEAGRVEY